MNYKKLINFILSLKHKQVERTYKYAILLGVTIFLASCKSGGRLNYFRVYRDVWGMKDFSDQPNWRERLADSTCWEFRIKSGKRKIVVWGTEIPLNDTFSLRHNNYGVVGQLVNGVPTGTWKYVYFRDFLTLEERFNCGRTWTMGCPIGGQERLDLADLFGENYNDRVKKKKQYTYRYYELTRMVLIFRNKLHKKIYEEQKSMW